MLKLRKGCQGWLFSLGSNLDIVKTLKKSLDALTILTKKIGLNNLKLVVKKGEGGGELKMALTYESMMK
jgi:hypothetical protein